MAEAKKKTTAANKAKKPVATKTTKKVTAAKTIKKPVATKAKVAKKPTLDKYYISEKPIKKTGDIEFNFKKAKQKTSRKYDEFIDVLKEFIFVSETSKNDTRVWFHRNGAYRGSVDLAKAKIILDRLTQQAVEKQRIIEYLEQENLVDKPEPKKVTKKVIIVEEPKPIDLNQEAKEATFFVPNSDLMLASEVQKDDIVASTPTRGCEVFVTNIYPSNGQMEVEYVVKNENNQSDSQIKTLYGFKQNPVVEEIITISDEEEKKLESNIVEDTEPAEVVDVESDENKNTSVENDKKSKMSKELLWTIITMSVLLIAALTILVLVATRVI
ncbi:hypothetical protein [Mycoplasmopsis fermentans]|uniref:hypothetical protein n=1 Tax=Mycoplasmopsis fermentans TaxID=2115 RepID=UPI0001E32FD1|nr:hypothetical protein [Mycoplasmopsis fermentans]ADN68791.1 conserved hypothetical membrane spanning protein [Mycoplasmopsis fermentans JER]